MTETRTWELHPLPHRNEKRCSNVAVLLPRTNGKNAAPGWPRAARTNAQRDKTTYNAARLAQNKHSHRPLLHCFTAEKIQRQHLQQPRHGIAVTLAKWHTETANFKAGNKTACTPHVPEHQTKTMRHGTTTIEFIEMQLRQIQTSNQKHDWEMTRCKGTINLNCAE